MIMGVEVTMVVGMTLVEVISKMELNADTVELLRKKGGGGWHLCVGRRGKGRLRRIACFLKPPLLLGFVPT